MLMRGKGVFRIFAKIPGESGAETMNQPTSDSQIHQLMRKIQESSDRIVELFDELSRTLASNDPVSVRAKHKTKLFRLI